MSYFTQICFSLLIFYPSFITVLASRLILVQSKISKQTTSEKLTDLWNIWDLRILVLLSMLMQVILIFFGPRRKFTSATWLTVLVWIAYLLADYMATVSLSTLSKKSQTLQSIQSSSFSHQLQVFWAPFLLLHLGGPDTITAYSLEDHTLWLRHLLSLVVQVQVALYAFAKSWNSEQPLTFLAIPVFVIGLIKCSERIWVLKSASFQGIQSSGGDITNPFYIDPVVTEGTYLQETSFLLGQIKDLFADLASLRVEGYNDASEFMLLKSPLEAFKLVEVQLEFMFDLLYTKAKLIYSQFGVILRSITLIFSISTLVAFIIIHKSSKISTIDIAITYVLIAGAVALEIYAIIILIFSNWTMLWLTKRKNSYAKAMFQFIYKFRGTLFNEKRWSRSMQQHNFINFCFFVTTGWFERFVPNCLKEYLFEYCQGWSNSTKEVTNSMEELIFEHVKEKRIRYKEQGYGYDVLRQILGERGDHVVQTRNCHEKLHWSTSDVDFDHSLFLWHIATDICYYYDKDSSEVATSAGFTSYLDASKALSDYMMYLVISHPKMLPRGMYKVKYEIAFPSFLKFAEGKHIPMKDVRKELLLGDITSRLREEGDEITSVLEDARRLAKLLQSLETEEGWSCQRKWEMIIGVWIEILTYAASRCGWEEHGLALKSGGELITHVAVLMANMDLSEQVRMPKKKRQQPQPS